MNEITPIFLPGKAKYLQLYEYMKQEIISGRMKPGDRLPSKRKLANHLGVSQNTVVSAYQQLSSEGYIDSKERRGLFVKKLDDLYQGSPRFPANSIKVAPDIAYDFSYGKVDLEHFPHAIWRKLTVESLDNESGQTLFIGDDSGEFLLREEIANYLYQSRGVKCRPDQIIIGAGTQYLIGLICLLLKEKKFAMEEPGYHRTRGIIEDYDIPLSNIPLDKDGLKIDLLTKSQSEVVYVTPSHQFPSGMVMPIARRIELLNWANSTNGFIIEDDYDGEFRYKGRPIPALQGLDSQERVIYLGSFSKSLIPSIRISFMVLPFQLLEVFQKRFSLYKQTVSRLHQTTLLLFMQKGHWDRHLNKMRTLYRKKYTFLLSLLQKVFDERVSVISENSGMHVLLEVNNGMCESQLIETAANHGVRVYPTSVFYSQTDKKDPIILLGFGELNLVQIEKGVLLLKKAWFSNNKIKTEVK